MNTFNPELLNDCEREPLAHSGLLQPHGAMLFLSKQTGTFSFGSANLEQYIGESHEDLLGEDGREWLSEMLPDLVDLPTSAGDRQYLVRALDLGEGELNALISPTADGWIIEFEFAGDDESSSELFNTSLPALSSLQDMATIQQAVVDGIANITGYDRVMLYQFLPDWSGEVLAESVQRSKGTYLSLRFPASDIPAIARGLYAQAPYRYIPLSTNDTVDIMGLADAGSNLDLTWSDLRSVSPVHIQYLTNMQVFASFSVSIMVEGKLWGLIASHNDAPGPIPLSGRLACTELIANFVERVNEQRVIQQKIIADSISSQIGSALSAGKSKEELAKAIVGAVSQLQGQVDFSACVIDVGGHTECSDPSIDSAVSEALLELSQETALDQLGTWESLPEDMAARAALWKAGIYGCGCFRLRAGAVGNALVTILLLRPEESGEVAWAGNPEKPVELTQTGTVKLSPRESFEKWVQVRRGMSRVWNEDDRFTMGLMQKQLSAALT